MGLVARPRVRWLWWRRVTVVAVALAMSGAIVATPAGAQESAPVAAYDQTLLPVPPAVRAQAEFWKRVFVMSEDQVLLHDTAEPARVFAELDFRHLRDAGVGDVRRARTMQDEIDAERLRISRVLRRLAGSPPANEEEGRFAAMFAGLPKAEMAEASQRIRAQFGIGERFARGISISRRYLPAIEESFRQEEVPAVLTRLALVESSFDVRAHSHAGAAGVWQFMPSTGRLFLRIDHVVDERLDPLLAGRAAARLLRGNYEALGTWPLAVTAYNHGRAGMARAVSQLGTTDIEKIIRRYQGRSFRFASRNFYGEVIAAIEVDAEYRVHFGEMPLWAPQPIGEVRLSHYVPLAALAGALDVDAEALLDLNPAFSREVRSGKLHLPRDYPIRIPAEVAPVFPQRYAALSDDHKHRAQRRAFIAHRIRAGQTLSGIARRYGTSVSAIQRANGMRGTRIIVGQSLKIPTSTSPAPQQVAAAASREKYVLHRVQPGQTLSSIARRYGTTVDAIRRANRLAGNRILSGQSLKVPTG